MDKKKLVIFDFDGVIVDTFRFSLEVRNKIALPVDEDTFRSFYNGNINEHVQKELGHGWKKAQWNFFNLYRTPLMAMPPIKNMDYTLEYLNRKYCMVIVSSTPSILIEDYLKQYNLNKYFMEILGKEVHTSKVVKIKKALEDYKVGEEECIFITDTLGDEKEATEAGVASIGVNWGFQRREILEEGQPVAIVDKPEEIIKEVGKYFSRV